MRGSAHKITMTGKIPDMRVRTKCYPISQVFRLHVRGHLFRFVKNSKPSGG